MASVTLTTSPLTFYSTSISLAQTGSNLYNIITGLSGAGAAGVSLGQLISTSGALQNQPLINLNGGTGLISNNIYFDSFGANRNLGFTGTAPVNSSYITLRANVTSLTTIGFPASSRVGQSGAVTGLTFTPGNHELSWIYSNAAWWLADTSSSTNTFDGIRAPTGTDDLTSGYSVGSRWINTGSQSSYECISASSGAAIWFSHASSSDLNATGAKIIALSGNLNQMAISVQTTGNWGPVLANVSSPFMVSMSGNIPQQVQLPSGDGFPTGAQFIIERYGTGTVAIVGTGTVAVQSRGSVSNLSGQFSVATAILRRYANWLIVGDLG